MAHRRGQGLAGCTRRFRCGEAAIGLSTRPPEAAVQPPSGTVAQSMVKVTSPRRPCASGHRPVAVAGSDAKPVLGWPARGPPLPQQRDQHGLRLWPAMGQDAGDRPVPTQAGRRGGRVDRRRPGVPSAARSGRSAAPGGRPRQQQLDGRRRPRSHIPVMAVSARRYLWQLADGWCAGGELARVAQGPPGGRPAGPPGPATATARRRG
jgi:hypothetical protein